MEQKHPIDRAADTLGGSAKLAGVLGVSAQAISNWKERGVPIDRCVAIEVAAQGTVKRWDLRPNDWFMHWPELVGTKGAPKVPSAGAAKKGSSNPDHIHGAANGKPVKHQEKPSTRRGS